MAPGAMGAAFGLMGVKFKTMPLPIKIFLGIMFVFLVWSFIMVRVQDYRDEEKRRAQPYGTRTNTPGP